jgi:hypothetical protein
MIRDDVKEIKIDVIHLVVFSFPKVIPLKTITDTDKATNRNDRKYASILDHHGKENFILTFIFLYLILLKIQ